MFRQQITLFLLLLFVNVDADTANKPTPFSVGSQYEYSYSAEVSGNFIDLRTFRVMFHFREKCLASKSAYK